MPFEKNLIAGLLLTCFLAMPAMAQLNITHFDDGKTLFENGSYWILWDSVGNHTAGDRFFINATTNLSPGTGIVTRFYNAGHQCHTGICRSGVSAAGSDSILGPGDASGIRHVSAFINTSGFDAGDSYFFDFGVLSPENPDEAGAMIGGQVKGLIVLYPASDESSLLPPVSALFFFAGTIWLIIIAIFIFGLRQ